ncbi:hypothetical protein [Nocardia sp. NPDC059228]|uniref:hypothetical protein n=1 Tax=Nocardia sp. NPDC059228 TaxID=3346777 RepID=UPI0036AE89C5
MPELLDDTHLEQTAVVANSAMNRDRRLPAYRRELARRLSLPALTAHRSNLRSRRTGQRVFPDRHYVSGMSSGERCG